MEYCPVCGNPARAWVCFVGRKSICIDCATRERESAVIQRGKSIGHPSDFRGWTGSDMSDLFWLTFIEYRKNPTKSGIELINRIFLWACHANHTLSSTIHYTLQWCGMDLLDERRKMRELEGEV